MPRPPEITISDAASSGRPVDIFSRRWVNFIFALALFTSGRSTAAGLPAWLSAAMLTLGRRMAIHLGHDLLRRALAVVFDHAPDCASHRRRPLRSRTSPTHR